MACGLVLLGALSLAQAQKMYRCGATYQDRPCAGMDSKVIGLGGATTSATPGEPLPVVDPMCSARGEAALRLMWARESGKTMDEQLARPGVDGVLVRKVYSLHGSSVQVRQAIEADCERELARQPAGGQPGLGGAASALPAPATASDPRTEGRGDQAVRQAEARAQAARADTCAAIARELSGLQAAQRAGGSASTMDELAGRARAAQARKRAAGC